MDGIGTAFTPGMATQDSAAAQHYTAQRTMCLQGLKSVFGATGLEAANIADPRFEEEPIALHQDGQRDLRQASQGRNRHAHAFQGSTRPNKESSSLRVACASATERAEMNSVGENGARRRTSQRPPGKPGPSR
jgi:hypothetical protein